MTLNNFLNPQALILLGASADKNKLGAQILENIIKANYGGKIIPVNPKGGRLAGLAVAPNVAEALRRVKNPIQALAVVVIPAKIALMELENLGRGGVKNIIIISAGFKEIGKTGKELEEKLQTISQKYKLNVLGPNCLGLINHFSNLNVSFSRSYGQAGSGVAVFSQSGAIGSALLDWSSSAGVAVPLFVSLGNKAVLSENDFLRYFCENKKSQEYKNISSFVLYLEEFSQGEELVSLISQIAVDKPVAILKAGKTSAGAQAAQSHTGSLAGSWSSAETGLKRAGAVILEDLKSLFSFLELNRRPVNFKRVDLAIISNAGGPGVLAIDKASLQDLKLKNIDKKLSLGLEKKLLKIKASNPLDLIGDASAEDYAVALKEVLASDNFNSVLVILTPQTSSQLELTAGEIVAVAKKYPQKNILTSFIGGQSLSLAKEILRSGKIPNFNFPEEAIEILSQLNRASLNKDFFGQLPKEKRVKTKKIKNTDYVSLFKLLNQAGIKTAKTFYLKGANDLKFPLALKASGPDFVHKSDKQAVYLDIDSQAKLKQAVASLRKIGADKKDNQIVIQEMLPAGKELIVGFKRDQSFGPLLLVGIGGIYTEILKDFSLGFGLLNSKQLTTLVRSLKLYPMMSGFRGQESLDLKALIKVLQALQKIAREYPEIKELEINPLRLYKKGAIAVDVRIVL